MHDRAMPHGHVLSDMNRESLVHMNHRIVLNIASPSDQNGRVIRPHHGMEPEAGILSRRHIPVKVCIWRDERRLFADFLSLI